MHFDGFRFGSIEIDGVTYEHDLVIDRGDIRKRKKKPSKQFSAVYGHTPLSTAESRYTPDAARRRFSNPGFCRTCWSKSSRSFAT